MSDKIPLEALEDVLYMALSIVPPLSRWRHYKGDIYETIGCCIREEDGAPMVLYGPADNDERANPIAFCRPLSEWVGKVWHKDLRGESSIVDRYHKLED